MPRVQAMVKVAAAQPEVNNDVELILISPDGTEAPITLEALLDTEITMRAPKPATSSANTQKSSSVCSVRAEWRWRGSVCVGCS
jgi:hypothetical protein